MKLDCNKRRTLNPKEVEQKNLNQACISSMIHNTWIHNIVSKLQKPDQKKIHTLRVHEWNIIPWYMLMHFVPT